MSVLIEALTLVVRKITLEISYPGGADAFLDATLKLDAPPRYACNGDLWLVNVSFYDSDHSTPAERLLRDAGLVGVDERSLEYFEYVFVDQLLGPTMPCPWLNWQRHKGGFTLAWDASQKVGDLAAPDGWTPAQSRALTRTDAREDRGRMLRLAEEEGFETYLDFETGAQHLGLANPVPETESRIRLAREPETDSAAPPSEEEA
jgi:hypothetical protein